MGQPRPEGAGSPSLKIEVLDQENNQKTTFKSISEAARTLNIACASIRRFLDTGKVFNFFFSLKVLNPSSDELENLSVKQQHFYLNNRIGRYLNIERPNGSPTELGHFYFARHPEYLPNLIKKASGFLLLIQKTVWFNTMPTTHKLVIVEQFDDIEKIILSQRVEYDILIKMYLLNFILKQ